MTDYAQLYAQLEQLNALIDKHLQHSRTVSKVSVGWHIAHSYLVIIKSCESFLQNPEKPKGINKWWFKQLLFFFLKRIPRNKVKAPKMVMPEAAHIEPEQLRSYYCEAKSLINRVSKRHSGFMSHPFLGPIKSDKFPLFLCIHTGHHLQIINEILQ